jgi:hypothetical protein
MNKIFVKRSEELENVRNRSGLDVFRTIVMFVLEIKIHNGVIDQTGTNGGKVANNGNVLALELVCRANSR